jgi:hypothetical protein
MTLAFLRSEDVVEQFEIIADCPLLIHADFERLANYWREFWLPRVKIFSVHGLERRTNNHVEGWNNGFRRRFHWPHPNFWNFLGALVEDQV